ncbi:MAG TPA: GNAT family N-acetyltransferase [Rhizomicrobium sp.]|jgi:GNAT superfamily N-acetyltransferase|nr:GNAT family N-acetyltransferase [Rhizomicrobium sp.]
MSASRIRIAELPRDRPAMLGFVDALQAFEHGFESNRRRDATVAEDYLQPLLQKLEEKDGEIFVAVDVHDAPIGWGVVQADKDDIYVIEAERRIAYIAELYLVEAARGTGVGRALIAACEDWARARGIGVLHIGVLPGNVRARAVYERAGFAPYALRLRKRLA